MPLTRQEQKLTEEIGFDAEVTLLLKSQGRLSRLLAIDDRGKVESGPGISVPVRDGDAAEKMMAAVQPELLSRGYRAFWSERLSGNGMKQSDEVVVLRTTDPYAIVRLRHTDGANYDVSTDDILARLAAWETLCQFEVVGASTSWVALRFSTLPTGLCRFVEEVYLFCPDAVEQGVGLKHESDDPEAFEEARRLCPEISPEIGNRLEGQASQLDGIAGDMAETLRSLMRQAAQFSTPSEMGVRLLAYELRRTKYLFLWWD